MNATLGELGELAVLSRLIPFLRPGGGVVIGAGDDCAVVAPGKSAATHWLLTSDPVIHNVHFGDNASGQQIGHKAVGRALSDIAAMGGRARWGLLDVVAPAATPVSLLEDIYRGATQLAGAFGTVLAGGDLARGPALELHVFAVGSAPAGRAVLRSGARPGDALFVTGVLGGSAAGRHLSFTPRLREGARLRAWASAMIDVSDGLAADARRLAAASGVGFELQAAALPLAPELARLAPRDAVRHALTDGEDFELLFCVPAARRQAFERAWRNARDLTPCTAVGRAVADPQCGLHILKADGTSAPLKESGYEHWTA